ncbi:MAG TPA: uroporphyrinogen-III synthase [Woeseiaceae bacterium]|nr:uroporphyrinogen-III synthase [Woeseiaceae bacterium]
MRHDPAEMPLAGCGVLVTRAAHQAAGLIEAVEQAGGEAIRFPVIEIQGRDPEILRRERDALPAPDIVVYTSPNAVRYAFDPGSDSGALVAAVGPATETALRSRGRTVDIRSPGGFDSEHLLAEAALGEVTGKIVRIVRGDRGRELLATTLAERGATVDYLSVYRRLPARHTDEELLELERLWRAGRVHVVTVMSVESLDNLLTSLPAHCRDALPATPLVTPSKRVIQTAADRIPAVRTVLAPGPLPADVLSAVIACRSEHRND